MLPKTNPYHYCYFETCDFKPTPRVSQEPRSTPTWRGGRVPQSVSHCHTKMKPPITYKPTNPRQPPNHLDKTQENQTQ